MGIIFQLQSVLSGRKEQIQKCFIENKTQAAMGQAPWTERYVLAPI